MIDLLPLWFSSALQRVYHEITMPDSKNEY